MSGRTKLCALAVAICFILTMVLPAYAADPQMSKRDLNGISPKRHRYAFSVLGGAAVGAGVGLLVGHKTELVKGLLIGGGGGSALYLHSHRNALNGHGRDFAYILSHTALGTGVGWTLCGCDDGAVAGALIGGGASAWWRASTPNRRTTTTAGTNP